MCPYCKAHPPPGIGKTVMKECPHCTAAGVTGSEVTLDRIKSGKWKISCSRSTRDKSNGCVEGKRCLSMDPREVARAADELGAAELESFGITQSHAIKTIKAPAQLVEGVYLYFQRKLYKLGRSFMKRIPQLAEVLENMNHDPEEGFIPPCPGDADTILQLRLDLERARTVAECCANR